MPIQQKLSSSDPPAPQNPNHKEKDFSWGWFVLAAIPIAICCGSPFIVDALVLIGPGVLAFLGVAWPITVGVGVLLILFLFGVRWYLRPHHSALSSVQPAANKRTQLRQDSCCPVERIQPADLSKSKSDR
jgi:hypothetical protein